MKTSIFLSLALLPGALFGAAGIGVGPGDEIISLPRASLIRSGSSGTSMPLQSAVIARTAKSTSSSLSREAALDMASLLAEQAKDGSIAVVADAPGARMAPALPPDSVLVLEAVSLDQIRPSDIITFERSTGMGVSRVIAINAAGARVCADQSNAVEIIDAKSIRKRVVAVLFCRAE